MDARDAAILLGSALDARRHVAARGIFPGGRLVEMLDEWLREAEGLVDKRGQAIDDWFVDGGVISNFPAWVYSAIYAGTSPTTPRYSANMGPDADRRTRFDANRGQSGYRFYRRRPYVCNIAGHLRLAQAGKLSADQNYGLPPADLAKIRPDRTWLASVPIFDPLDSWRPPPRPGTAFPPVEGLHPTAELDDNADGGVLGVLNLDANCGDNQRNWPADTDISLTGAPAEFLIDTMSVVVPEVGRLLSDAFAPPRRDP